MSSAERPWFGSVASRAECVILRAEGDRLLMLITSEGKMKEFDLPLTVATALLSQAGKICADIIAGNVDAD